jgi:endonuclease/exonuclease/phosphatase family metal-dependent hydrolase
VFSANLRRGGADPEALEALLRLHDVDVAAFQEFSGHQQRAVASVLPGGSLPLGDPPKMALALRRSAAVERIALRGRHALRALLQPEDWPGLAAPLEIVSAHIQAPHLWPAWRSLALRRVQLRGLLSHLGATPDLHRVVVGDLNATPLWPVYRRLTRVLEDAALLHARSQSRSPDPTWSPWPEGRRILRIDHGLVGRVKVHDFRVLPVAGSDHAGILLEVSPAI